MDAHRDSRLGSPYAQMHNVLKTTCHSLPRRREALGGCQCNGREYFSSISLFRYEIDGTPCSRLSCFSIRVLLRSEVRVDELEIDISKMLEWAQRLGSEIMAQVFICCTHGSL